MRNHTNVTKIRHTASAPDRPKEAHKLLTIPNQLANELEEVFNNWSKVRLTDRATKRLIQLAMAPNKETLQSLKNGGKDEFSSVFTNVVDNVLKYAGSNPSQQEATTKGTLFGAYYAVTGYFQNIRNYKDDEARFKHIMYRTGLQRSQTAFDLCTDFAKHCVSALN